MMKIEVLKRDIDDSSQLKIDEEKYKSILNNLYDKVIIDVDRNLLLFILTFLIWIPQIF